MFGVVVVVLGVGVLVLGVLFGVIMVPLVSKYVHPLFVV